MVPRNTGCLEGHFCASIVGSTFRSGHSMECTQVDSPREGKSLHRITRLASRVSRLFPLLFCPTVMIRYFIFFFFTTCGRDQVHVLFHIVDISVSYWAIGARCKETESTERHQCQEYAPQTKLCFLPWITGRGKKRELMRKGPWMLLGWSRRLTLMSVKSSDETPCAASIDRIW